MLNRLHLTCYLFTCASAASLPSDHFAKKDPKKIYFLLPAPCRACLCPLPARPRVKLLKMMDDDVMNLVSPAGDSQQAYATSLEPQQPQSQQTINPFGSRNAAAVPSLPPVPATNPNEVFESIVIEKIDPEEVGGNAHAVSRAGPHFGL